MTATLFIIWSALAAFVTAVLLALLAAGELRMRRCRSRDAVLRTKYLHIVLLALASGECLPPHFPLLRLSGARRLLAENIAGIVGATYGLDAASLRRIVAETGLDAWLLRRVGRARGYRRARLLALLAQLPSDAAVQARIVRYLRSRNPYTRFYALMAQLVSDPSTALRLMAEYPAPFTACEVAEIMTVLRRGMLPIAYEPLLESPDRNLRRVGLAIVRQFGVEEAEEHLLHIVAGDPDAELVREALYTLCSMRRPLEEPEVRDRIRVLPPDRRKALLRYMAAEGYSPAELQRVFCEHEQPYYESLVKSYKRSLSCR